MNPSGVEWFLLALPGFFRVDLLEVIRYFAPGFNKKHCRDA